MSDSPSSSESALGAATVSGVRWLAVARIVSESVGLASIVALARLMSPAAFGHSTIALIFVVLGDILCFEGFSSVLVQREVVTEEDRAGAMFMACAFGLLLASLVYLIGPLVRRPLFGSETASLIQLISPSIAILSVAGVSRSTLWRALNFRTVSMVDTFSQFIAAVVAVSLAIDHQGARSLVWGSLAGAVVTTVVYCVISPPPIPRWSRQSQRDLTSYGLPSAMSGLAITTFQNIDYAILAIRLPATTVGLYYRAFNVSVVYQDKLSRIMSQLALPVYARTEGPAQLAALHERVARLHATIIFPFLATLAALAPILVPFVFGPQWHGAVPATEILAGAGGCAAILTGFPQVMLALGKARQLLRFCIGMVVIYGATILLVSRHGLVVIAFGVCIAYLLILIGAYQFLFKPALGLTVTHLLVELAPALVGCAALVGVEVGIREGLTVLPGIVVAVIAAAAGFGAYGLVLRLVFPRAYADFRLLVDRVIPPSARRRLVVWRPPTSPVAPTQLIRLTPLHDAATPVDPPAEVDAPADLGRVLSAAASR